MSKKQKFDEKFKNAVDIEPQKMAQVAVVGLLSESNRLYIVAKELEKVISHVKSSKVASKSFYSLIATDADSIMNSIDFFARNSFSLWLRRLCLIMYENVGLEHDEGHFCLKDCEHEKQFYKWLFSAFHGKSELKKLVVELRGTLPRKDNCSNDKEIREVCQKICNELAKDKFMAGLAEFDL